jgi:hypothetical protein
MIKKAAPASGHHTMNPHSDTNFSGFSGDGIPPTTNKSAKVYSVWSIDRPVFEMHSLLHLCPLSVQMFLYCTCKFINKLI